MPDLQLLAGSQDTWILQWHVLSTVARPSAFGRGPGSAEFLQWCWCTGVCLLKLVALCVGIFYGVFLCPHSFSVVTVSGNAPFGLLIILPVARL